MLLRSVSAFFVFDSCMPKWMSWTSCMVGLRGALTNDIFISMAFHRCTKGEHDTSQGSRAVW
jgi:hypothetical protein